MTAATNTAPQNRRLHILLRTNAALLAVLAALSSFFFVSVIRGLPTDFEADHRLAPTFGLLHGYHLYYPPDSGPALSTLYGPVTALFYLPATLASTPMSAILIGTLWAMLIFFAAVFVTIRVAAKNCWMTWWQLFGLMAGLVWFVGPVERNAAHIHADAPALACSALACLFAMRNRSRCFTWENEIISALFGVLAVFAKQNVVPVLLGLALWFSLRGAPALLRFVASAIVFAAVMIAVTVTVLSSPAAFFFNCFAMPLHQPLDKTLLFPTIAQLCVFSLGLLLIPVARLTQVWIQSQSSLREFLLEQKTPMLIIVGLLMIPAAIAGRMKLGGNENSLGLALVFFVLALVSEIASTRDGDEINIRLWALPVVVLCIVGLFSAVYFSAKPRPRSPIAEAYAYAKQHPGQVYFPQFPLVHLMAEGKLYHFSWGLTDRRNAGVPVSAEHFRADIPPQAKVIAVTGFVPLFESDMASRQGPRMNDFAGAAQLPQFEFFAMPAKDLPQQ